jgi:hypothetical protein
MRHTHRQSPFHRIECWTGFYFRRAALWEVGNYILVEHHTKSSICEALRFQTEFLETLQVRKDQAEQSQISDMVAASASRPASARSSEAAFRTDMEEQIVADDGINRCGEEALMNDEFFHSLDQNGSRESDDVDHNDWVDDEDAEHGGAETDVKGFVPYLGTAPASWSMADAGADAGATANAGTTPGAASGRGMPWNEDTRPGSDGLNNTYVRIVHTNGIHHLAMVTCLCQGEQNVPLDLVASRLLPASLTRIRTLFTTSLLDYFRLCNLELKASAYQFYQLLRRLTRPIGNAEIVNLYNEFRRMSRLWRWMKKLKWAGYGHNQEDPLRPRPGSLANFCATCPQPGINLPEDWKSDRNRWGILCYDHRQYTMLIYSHLKICL